METISLPEPILEIRLNDKSFNSNQIIKDLELVINTGETVSIVGRSGIGKSTLLKIISGIDSDFNGKVIFNGSNLESPTNEIAFLFQGHILIPWLNVKSNIKFICNNITDDEIHDYLKSVGIDDKFNEWPNRLSGGEKTRVGLSVALINKSRLLLLDEPFSDLDIGVKNGIIKLLNKIKAKNNTTILMTTHNIEDALSLSERVLVIGQKPSTIVFDAKITDENKAEIKKTITNILS